jgi:hypothetical protein
MRGRYVGSSCRWCALATVCDIEPFSVDGHWNRVGTASDERCTGRTVAGVFHPDLIARCEERVSTQAKPMLCAAYNDDAVGITSQPAINSERCGDLATKIRTSPRIAVSEIEAIGLRNAAAGGIGKAREKRRLDEGLTEAKWLFGTRRGQHF